MMMLMMIIKVYIERNETHNKSMILNCQNPGIQEKVTIVMYYCLKIVKKQHVMHTIHIP